MLPSTVEHVSDVGCHHVFWSWKTRVNGVVLLARKVIPTENRAIGRVSFPPGQETISTVSDISREQ